ncbi:unnamed protein product, partial [Rhizoctonia solani]
MSYSVDMQIEHANKATADATSNDAAKATNKAKRRRSKSFTWSRSGIVKDVKIKGISTAISTADCLVRKRSPACHRRHHLDEKYLQLPSLFGGDGYIISCLDLIRRVDEDSWENVLSQDVQDPQWVVKCDFWDMKGNKIDESEIQKSRLGQLLRHLKLKSLTESLVEALEAYRREWILCFKFAISIANRKVGNPFKRFFVQPPGSNLPLCIVPNPARCGNIDFKTAIQAATVCDPNVEVKVVDKNSPDLQGCELLSTNPLGLYETWINRKDLDKLVRLQTNGQRWAREPPSTEQAQPYDEHLRRFRKNQIFPHQKDPNPVKYRSLALSPGDIVAFHERRNTKTIMGGSANEWASQKYKWPKTGGKHSAKGTERYNAE